MYDDVATSQLYHLLCSPRVLTIPSKSHAGRRLAGPSLSMESGQPATAPQRTIVQRLPHRSVKLNLGQWRRRKAPSTNHKTPTINNIAGQISTEHKTEGRTDSCRGQGSGNSHFPHSTIPEANKPQPRIVVHTPSHMPRSPQAHGISSGHDAAEPKDFVAHRNH